MNLEKISTTLYDVLGYVLPGFVLLFSFCILEASFLNSHALYLSRFAKHPVFTVIIAYVIGQITHTAAGWAKERFRKIFTDEHNRLSPRLQARIAKELCDFYGVDGQEQKLSTLEMYQMAEAYAGVSGGFVDREVYMAHEGFAKSAMVATVLFAVVLCMTAFVGGAVVQVGTPPVAPVHLTLALTLLCSLLCLFGAGVFRKRFLFFSRLKGNHTLLAFLARRLKEKPADSTAAGQPEKLANADPVFAIADPLKSNENIMIPQAEPVITAPSNLNGGKDIVLGSRSS